MAAWIRNVESWTIACIETTRLEIYAGRRETMRASSQSYRAVKTEIKKIEKE